jgi:hypothetical protein
MAAQPLVDLSALWEMYSALSIVATVPSQEVCETEEEVGGMGIMCSGIENRLEKNLSIVGVRNGSGATEGVRLQPFRPLPGQRPRVLGEFVKSAAAEADVQ